ncbi:MAG: archaeosortase C [Methanosarcinaceae archaeon]|nr:archaeosortase C [Methanosarcinaceae archaeon]
MNADKNLILILMTLALFIGATIELSEGSPYMGVVLLLTAVGVISRIRLTGKQDVQQSKLYLSIGVLIVVADLLYNFRAGSDLGTLDSMVFFFGLSLIAMGTDKPQLSHIGEFGAYISGIFTVLFVIFYSIFGALNIQFLYFFDHYLVLMPTVLIIKLMGVPVEVVAIQTVELSGVENLTIIIGGPCSGLYSMFLLIGIVVGYSRMEKMKLNKTLYLLGFAIAVAYISNLVRVTILYLAAYQYGMETMMMVHTHLGWIIFALVAGGIMYIMDLKR